MASEAELAALRPCEKEGCAMSNHLAAAHPSNRGSEGGGAKGNAAIPQLEEGTSEIQWSAWQVRFDRWALASKLSDKAIENWVWVWVWFGLVGNDNKENWFVKIKAAVIKKRSVLLYRKDLHQITQGRNEDPERYAARIKQAVPPCCLTTDSGTADYGPDLANVFNFHIGLGRFLYE